MTSLRAFFFLAAICVSALFTYACSSGDKCGPSTCPSGCCDAEGECRSGLLDADCGTGGNACTTCSGVEICQGGTCVALGAQNPDAGNPNAACLESCTGCCNGGQCQPGNLDTACGRGDVCKACGTGQQCLEGQCVLVGCNGCKAADGTCDESGDANASACGLSGVTCQTCTSGTCAGGVCAGCTGCYDGLNVCRPGTTRALCGTGGAVCDACGENEACTNGVCVQTCKSNGASCAVGAECCSDTCTGGLCAPAQTDAGMCKSNGAACAIASECCSSVCSGGVCGGVTDAGNCGPENCPGCCSAGGSCLPGTDTNACGSGGDACAACSDEQVCTAGVIGGICESSGASCGALGASCAGNFACCSAFCSGGQCAPNPSGGAVTSCGPGVTNLCGDTNAGPANPETCDPCVQVVCDIDDYCCLTRWDSQCASYVPANCPGRCGP